MTGSTGSAASSSATMAANTGANLSEWHSVQWLVSQGFATVDGSPLLGDPTGLGYSSMAAWNSALGSIRVNVASATEIDIWAFEYDNAWCLQQDGVDVGTRQKFGVGTVMVDAVLATGLSGTHLYRILGCAGATSYQTAVVAAMRFVGGTLTGTAPAALPIVTCFGDSICGSGSAPDDSRTMDFWLGALNNGYSAQIATYAGMLVSGAGGLATRTSVLQLYGNGPPAITVLEGGTNDQAASVPTGPGSTFRTAYSSMIAGAKAVANPATHLIVRAPLPNADTNSANWGLYVTDVAAAATAAGVCVEHTGTDTSAGGTYTMPGGAPNWINPASTEAGCTSQSYPPTPTADTQEGIHPCAAATLAGDGYGKVANREAPVWAGYTSGSSFTVTGPATGTTGANLTLTLALPGAATWIDQVVATSSVPTDCMSFNNGPCTYGSATLPVSNGNNSVTLSVRLSTVGSRTITYSGTADCWTVPVPTTLTATTGAPVSGFLFGRTWETPQSGLADNTRESEGTQTRDEREEASDHPAVQVDRSARVGGNVPSDAAPSAGATGEFIAGTGTETHWIPAGACSSPEIPTRCLPTDPPRASSGAAGAGGQANTVRPRGPVAASLMD